MTRLLRVATLCLAATTLVLVPLGAQAGAKEVIRAGQHFDGVVNGHRAGVTVRTACADPATPARTAPIVGKQTVSVTHDRKGHGFTGLFDSIYVWFAPASPRMTPVQLKLTTYDASKTIPTSVLVPCSGSGTVVFSSCPYLASCAAGSVTDDVKVRFVNVAA
jgi:hypothetical protein